MGFFSRLFGGGEKETPKPVEQPKNVKVEYPIIKQEPITLINGDIVEAEKILYVDLETTGFDASRDEILQVSIINDNGETVYDKYFKPAKVTNWNEAQKINKISPSMVRNCPNISKEKDALYDILHNAEVLFFYNSKFDMGFIDKYIMSNMASLLVNQVDVLKLARQCIPDIQDHKLMTVAANLGFDFKAFPAHNSLNDVRATKHVLDYICKEGHTDKATLIYLSRGKGIKTPGEIKGAEGLYYEDVSLKAKKLFGADSFWYNGNYYSYASDFTELGEASKQRDLQLKVLEWQVDNPPTKVQPLYKKKVFFCGLLKNAELITLMAEAGATIIEKPLKTATYVVIGEYNGKVSVPVQDKLKELRLAGSQYKQISEAEALDLINQ